MAARPQDSFSTHAAPLLAFPVAIVLSAALASLAGPATASDDPDARAVEAEVLAPTRAAPRERAAAAPTRRGAANAPPPVPARAEEPTAAPTSVRWRRMESMRCFRDGGQTFCDGPLRVPARQGPAAERASALGLDDERRVGSQALNEAPEVAWSAAVAGERGAGLLWPVSEGRMWRGYGQHRELEPMAGGGVREGAGTRLHPGVDIGAPAGAAVRAVDRGLVLYSYNGMRGYGNSVILLHPDDTVTLYAHCRATLVVAGERVRRGQVIAEVGRTGLAHGDHLHFEWRREGHPLNPTPLFVDVPERGE